MAPRFTLKALLAACAAAFAASAAQAADFRSAEIHPEDYPTTQAVRHLGELIKQRSNGRLGIKVYAGGALGSENDSIEQVKLGALAMARINSAAMHNICEVTRIPALPFLFRSTEHLHKVLDGPIGEEMLKGCEQAGFVGLAWYDSGSRSIYSRTKPVKTPADTQGMKMRVQQSDLSVAMVEAMGGNATPMPYGEVYTGLKTGLIDAAENNLPSYQSSRHFEGAKFLSMTEHTMTPEMLVFSKRQWDKLPAADQQIIRDAARESVPYMRKLWDARETEALKAVQAGGAQISQVDKPAFQAAMKPVYDRFVTTAQAKDLVQRIQAVQ